MKSSDPSPSSETEQSSSTSFRLHLDHASIMTTDLDEAVSFYVDLLGLECRVVEDDPIREGRRRAMLGRRGEGHCRTDRDDRDETSVRPRSRRHPSPRLFSGKTGMACSTVSPRRGRVPVPGDERPDVRAGCRRARPRNRARHRVGPELIKSSHEPDEDPLLRWAASPASAGPTSSERSAAAAETTSTAEAAARESAGAKAAAAHSGAR